MQVVPDLPPTPVVSGVLSIHGTLIANVMLRPISAPDIQATAAKLISLGWREAEQERPNAKE